jgi:hypothetical protein
MADDDAEAAAADRVQPGDELRRDARERHLGQDPARAGRAVGDQVQRRR